MYARRALLVLALLLPALADPRPTSISLTLDGRAVPLKPSLQEWARGVDTDHDGRLSDAELEKKTHAKERLLQELKYSLSDTRLPELALYPDADAVEAKLRGWCEACPDRARLVALGTTHEGRTIWAVRLGLAAPSARPAFVFTGATHAREWASLALTLQLGETLLHDDARLARAEFWLVPLVNPDGYQFTREHDNQYRKNRRPEGGVDVNRNYGEPDRATLWRNDGDLPAVTSDDVGASDQPNSEIYRGPAPASEPETRALQSLILGNGPRPLGVIDHHGFGDLLLYPATAPESDYADLAEKMNQAAGGSFKVMNAARLYRMTGNSMDLLQSHGVRAITLEVGHSFQPQAAELERIYKEGVAADLAFIDALLDSSQAPPR